MKQTTGRVQGQILAACFDHQAEKWLGYPIKPENSSQVYLEIRKLLKERDEMNRRFEEKPLTER